MVDWAELATRVERWLLPAECMVCRAPGRDGDDSLVCGVCRARWRAIARNSSSVLSSARGLIFHAVAGSQVRIMRHMHTADSDGIGP